MSRQLPLLPTIVVAMAVATMIGLGIWQLARAGEKEALLARYASAPREPAISFPTAPMKDLPLFRQARGFCLQPAGRTTAAGASQSGEPGFVHIVSCRTGAEGPGMAVEVGWSKDPKATIRWAGGPVSGIIVPDRNHKIRLHSNTPANGLQPSAPASLQSIPNNHRFYAVQWFLFAVIALIIYVFALRNRWEKRQS